MNQFSPLQWVVFALLVPGTILMVGKMILDKRKGKEPDAMSVTMLFPYAYLWLALFTRTLAEGWLSWTLIGVQFLLIAIMFKRLWHHFKQHPFSLK